MRNYAPRTYLICLRLCSHTEITGNRQEIQYQRRINSINDYAQKGASYYIVLLPFIYTGLSRLRFLCELLHALLNVPSIIIHFFPMRYLHLSTSGGQHCVHLILNEIRIQFMTNEIMHNTSNHIIKLMTCSTHLICH